VKSNLSDNKIGNSNDTISEAVKASKKRVRSPYAYLKVLGLYSKSNLLEDVLKMYKTAVYTYQPNPPSKVVNQSIKPIETRNVNYYSTVHNNESKNSKIMDMKQDSRRVIPNRKNLKSPQPRYKKLETSLSAIEEFR
jgi:hypothetical protein